MVKILQQGKIIIIKKKINQKKMTVTMMMILPRTTMIFIRKMKNDNGRDTSGDSNEARGMTTRKRNVDITKDVA
jgi:C4-dicarboxylate transporter